MKVIFSLILLFTISLCYGQSCDLVKYQSNNGKMTNFYKRLSSTKTCNGAPIYKMLQNSFYMYKSPDGFWCDSYIPSNIVVCQAACEEIRFDLKTSTFVDANDAINQIIPEEYDSRFRVWEPKTSEQITCADNEKETLDNLFHVDDSNINKPLVTEKPTTTTTTPTTTTTTTTIAPKQVNRFIQTELNGNLIENRRGNGIVNQMKSLPIFQKTNQNQIQIQNVEPINVNQNQQRGQQRLTNFQIQAKNSRFNPLFRFGNRDNLHQQQQQKFFQNPQLVTNNLRGNNVAAVAQLDAGHVRAEDPNLVVTGMTQNGGLLGGSQLISAGSNVLSSNGNINRVENPVITNLTQNAKNTIKNALDSGNSEPGIQFENGNKIAANRKFIKGRILSVDGDDSQLQQPQEPRTISCPLIEYQIFDDARLVFKLSLPIYFGVNCKGYPVYKSSNNIYLYRNMFGDWCHEKMNQFLADVRCLQRCTQKRLLPTGITSPIDSNKIEIYNQITKNTLIASNHRYTCAGVSNCALTGCLNNGTCVSSLNPVTGNTENKCQCTQYFTGLLCDTVLDSCYSMPCMNGGSCLSSPFDSAPKCSCPVGYTGSKCEIIQNPCALKNQCLNGGTCIARAANTQSFYCECPATFEGKLCEREVIATCRGQPEGSLFPHPTQKSQFLLCLNNGQFQLQTCPGGLVYNIYLKRCDYNADEPDINNPCKASPCKNGATCTNIDDGFTCDCHPGYTGQLCETNIDECENVDCGENANCVDLINGWVCLCPNNFYGSDCKLNKIPIPCKDGVYKNVTRHLYPFDPSVIVECNERGKILLNKCASSLYWDPFVGTCTFEPVNFNTPIECLKTKCLNRGKCVLDRKKNPFCLCEKGYEGEFCEKNIDDCASNPCYNNATCVDGIDRYHCLCVDKYIDRNCYDVAAENPCKSVVLDSQNKTDSTVRHEHPFTKEKYLVCNLEGFAQVLSCPVGLYWNQTQQTCEMIDSREIYDLYSTKCREKDSKTRFAYEYSQLKYVQCGDNSLFQIQTCPNETPYYCESVSECVSNYDFSCQNVI